MGLRHSADHVVNGHAVTQPSLLRYRAQAGRAEHRLPAPGSQWALASISSHQLR